MTSLVLGFYIPGQRNHLTCVQYVFTEKSPWLPFMFTHLKRVCGSFGKGEKLMKWRFIFLFLWTFATFFPILIKYSFFFFYIYIRACTDVKDGYIMREAEWSLRLKANLHNMTWCNCELVQSVHSHILRIICSKHVHQTIHLLLLCT